MQTLTLIHVSSAILAIALGAIALSKQKGKRAHKLSGYSFCIFMLLTDITGFLFLPKHGFSVFQLLAMWSLFSLAVAIYYVVAKPNQNWLLMHYYFIVYAYLGVVAAAVARLPQSLGIEPALSALIGIILTFSIGALLIERHARLLLAKPPQRLNTQSGSSKKLC